MTKHLSATELDGRLSDTKTFAALRTIVAAFAAWKARAPALTDFDLEQATALANVVAVVEKLAAKQAERGMAYFAMDHFEPALREAWDLWQGADFDSVAQRSACQTWPRLDPREADWRGDPEAAAVIRVQCAWLEYQLALGVEHAQLADDYVRQFFAPAFAKTEKRSLRPDWIPKVVAHLLGNVDLSLDKNGDPPLEPAQGRKFREYGARTHWPKQPETGDTESNTADARLAQMQWARMPYGGDRGAFFGADSNRAEWHADAIAQEAIGPMFRRLRTILTDHGVKWHEQNPDSAIAASADDRSKVLAALVGQVNAPDATFLHDDALTAGIPPTFAATVTGNAFAGRPPAAIPFVPQVSKLEAPPPTEDQAVRHGRKVGELRVTGPARSTGRAGNPQTGRGRASKALVRRASANSLLTAAGPKKGEFEIAIPTAAVAAFQALENHEDFTAEMQRAVARRLYLQDSTCNLNTSRGVVLITVSSAALVELADSFCRVTEDGQEKLLKNPKWVRLVKEAEQQRRRAK